MGVFCSCGYCHPVQDSAEGRRFWRCVSCNKTIASWDCKKHGLEVFGH